MKELIAAVIVTFNRLDKLKLCIKQTLAEQFDYVIVVDNSSTDGTADWLAGLADKRLQIVLLDKNCGGAGGFHEGIKYAAKYTRADWICCFDDDAYPSMGLIDIFHSSHKNSRAAIVASAVYSSIDGSILEMNRPVTKLTKNLLDFLSYTINRSKFVVTDDAYSRNDLVDIAAASMIGLFIRKKNIMNNIGLPDKNLFIYCDDLIFTSGAKLSGEVLLFDPSLIFFHSCLNGDGRACVPWKVYFLARNHVLYYRKIAPRSYFIMSLIRLCYVLSKAMRSDDKFYYIYLAIKGYIHGLRWEK